MASIFAITTSRVRDGKFDEIVALYGRLKRLVERHGGKARVIQQTYGATPTTLSFVAETEGWAGFAALTEKLEADGEYQAVLAEARANPRSDIIQRSVGVEIAV